MSLNDWVQWMTVIGAIFTIITSATAIIGIYTWLMESYYKKHPFIFDDATENIPVIHVRFINHLNRTITIEHSELI